MGSRTIEEVVLGIWRIKYIKINYIFVNLYSNSKLDRSIYMSIFNFFFFFTIQTISINFTITV